MTGVKEEAEEQGHDLLSQHNQRASSSIPVRAASVLSNSAAPPVPSSPSSGTMGGRETDGSGDTTMSDTLNTADLGAMQSIGARSRQLIQVIQKLEALSIDSTLPSLPKFVVIGDQSAGKSSIIEAACEISLPRNEGTCTRCPFKITTSAAPTDTASWVCKIALHQKYSYTPGRGTVGNGGGFKDWMLASNDTMPFDFMTVTNKQDLGLALRRAQLAILNPQHDPRQYLHVPLTGQAKTNNHRVDFSPNIINLEITGDGLPEMSFYDLPGAINTFGDENKQYLVEFVEDLLKSYVGDEKSFIVLACAANQDLEVSTALRFLRQCQASRRSMGVLTKPDLIDLHEGRVQYLQDLLVGKTGYTFGDGCFVTRQLSQKELENGLSYEDARAQEVAFFAQDPWTTKLAPYADRFGIQNLQKAISEKLTSHILHELPEIVQRVQARLTFIERELSTFPVEDADPHVTVIMEIGKVEAAVSDEVYADSVGSKFRKPYRDIFRKLGKAMQACKPKVVLATPGYKKPSISLDSSDAEESPSKIQRTNNGRASMTPSQSAKQNRRRATPGRPVLQESNGTIFRLDEVKMRFDGAPGADLPEQASDVVIRSLILDTNASWSGLARQTVDAVKDLFIKMLDDTITKTLAQHCTTELYRETSRITRALLENLISDVSKFVDELVQGERHRPITYNDEHSRKRAAHEVEQRKKRQEIRVEEHFDVQESLGYNVPKKAEQLKKSADDAWVTAAIDADEYEREVKSLATPLAYYEIASAQLIDCIAKQFEYALMHKYRDNLKKTLLVELNTRDIAHCAQLLAEDPERERKRTELRAEKAKLVQALNELNALPDERA